MGSRGVVAGECLVNHLTTFKTRYSSREALSRLQDEMDKGRASNWCKATLEGRDPSQPLVEAAPIDVGGCGIFQAMEDKEQQRMLD